MSLFLFETLPSDRLRWIMKIRNCASESNYRRWANCLDHLNPPGNEHSFALSFKLIRGEELLYWWPKSVCGGFALNVVVMVSIFHHHTVISIVCVTPMSFDTMIRWDMKNKSKKRVKWSQRSIKTSKFSTCILPQQSSRLLFGPPVMIMKLVTMFDIKINIRFW